MPQNPSQSIYFLNVSEGGGCPQTPLVRRAKARPPRQRGVSPPPPNSKSCIYEPLMQYLLFVCLSLYIGPSPTKGRLD